MILAQSITNFTAMQLFVWLGILAFLALLTNSLFSLVKNVKGSPSPGEVQNEVAEKYQLRGDYVTRGEFEAMRAGLDTLATAEEVKQLTATVEGNRKAAETSRARLYDKVEAVNASLIAKIDAQPDRIIAQLSNLGVLRRPGQH